MANLEKAIKGLSVCKKAPLFKPDCDGCPYYDVEDCVAMMADDAFSLLKSQQARIAELETAQRPRVMTLEEVQNLQPGTDIWIECHVLEGWKSFAATVREIYDNGMLCELQSLKYGFDRYGRYDGGWLAWRCWTSRPTDEQREAVKWG